MNKKLEYPLLLLSVTTNSEGRESGEARSSLLPTVWVEEFNGSHFRLFLLFSKCSSLPSTIDGKTKEESTGLINLSSSGLTDWTGFVVSKVVGNDESDFSLVLLGSTEGSDVDVIFLARGLALGWNFPAALAAKKLNVN